MVYFKFSVPVTITLLPLALSYVMFESNTISSPIHVSCNITPTPDDEYTEPAIKDFVRKPSPPYHLPECEEQPMKIKHGYIIPLFHIRYTVTCDENHILPLGAINTWECKSAGIAALNNSPPEAPDRQFRVRECVEKQLPTTIYIERGVYIHNADDCQNGIEAYIIGMKAWVKRERHFLIQKLEFFLQLQPDQSECTIIISRESHILGGKTIRKVAPRTTRRQIFRLQSRRENTDKDPQCGKWLFTWVAYLLFRLVHKPIYKKITNSVLDEANCRLAAAVTEIMVENNKAKPREIFHLTDPDTAFHAGPCPEPGFMVDKKYMNGFTNEVPFCQACMRGYFLDAGQGVCRVCQENHYTGTAGSTSCRPCPTIHTTSKLTPGDSIMDCYDYESKSNKDAVVRGLIFILTFHVTYVAILMWIVRRYIRDKLIMGGRKDDDQVSS